MADDTGLLVHIAEAARMLGPNFSEYKVRLLVKKGTLPTEDIGSKRTYIPASAVKAYKRRIESMGEAS